MSFESQIAYHRGTDGSLRQWRTWTEGPVKIAEHGHVGGTLTKSPVTCIGKNIGKVNETTPEQQAIAEAKADFEFKLKRKYRLTIAEVDEFRIAPMCAPTEKWDDKANPKKSTKKYAKYPGHIQLKYDGWRCLAMKRNGKVVLISRGGVELNLPHIAAELEKIMPDDTVFDGELYIHGIKLQRLQHMIASEEAYKFEYRIYDIPISDGEQKLWHDPSGEYGSRYEDLQRLIPMVTNETGATSPCPDTPHIYRAPTWTVENEEQVNMCKLFALEHGYEGVMFRNWLAAYLYSGKRSRDLLKIKPFIDDEFVIVGFKDGTGKNEGVITWRCKINTPCSKGCGTSHTEFCDSCTFYADPTGDEFGSYDERKRYFQNGHLYLGRLMKVKFLEWSLDLIPLKGKAIAFREVADMDPVAPNLLLEN